MRCKNRKLENGHQSTSNSEVTSTNGFSDLCKKTALKCGDDKSINSFSKSTISS